MTSWPAGVRLGLRMIAATRRESAVRMSLITAGVGVGVGLLLLVLTAIPALHARQERTAWRATGAAAAADAPGGLWWLATDDHYRGRDLIRVYLAAAGPAAPVPRGLTRLPAPGEVAVSPALSRLLAVTPADELAIRLPGRVTATVGPAGLASPDDLVAFVGAGPEQIRGWGGVRVTGIADRPSTIIVNGYLRIMVIVAAAGLLVPVVVFIGMVTRVGAARREERYAAIRLVGATNGQISTFAGVETGLAAAVGTLLGAALYLAARPAVAALVTFDGLRFYPSDVRVPAGQLAAVLCGVPLLATAAAIAALRRVRVSPLGVTRRARRRPPGRWRLAVPAAGLAGFLGVALLRGLDLAPANGGAIILLTASSLLLALVGLVLAGAWMCLAVARVLARGARRAPALMAARRLAADPGATFRAVSGVVLASFVTALFAGVTPDPATRPLEHDQLRPGIVEVLTEGRPAAAVATLAGRVAGLPGVGRILVVHDGDAPHSIAVSCADLAAVVNVACQAQGPALNGSGLPPHGLIGVTAVVPPRNDGPVHALYVFTTGAAAEDRVRAAGAAVLPAAITQTRTDQVRLDDRQLRELNNGLRTGTAFVLLVGACSLTVAAIGALVERRRPFALLRAAGMHLAELRGVVLLETALPLVVTTLVGGFLGFAASAAVARSSGQPWHPPGPGYLLAMLGGLAVAGLVTGLTLPLIAATTRPQAVRFD